MEWTPLDDATELDDEEEEEHPHHPTIPLKIYGMLDFLFLRRLDFKFYWTMHYIVFCIIGGIVICMVEDLPFVDSIFMATSAMTGAGLCTYPMSRFGTTTFAVCAILMMIGCAPFMLIPVTLYRRHRIALVMNRVTRLRQAKKLPPESQLTRLEQSVVKDYDQVDDALGILGYIFVGFFISAIVIGMLCMVLTLQLRPMRPELKHRGVTYFDDASYLAVSAFANAGLAIASDNLFELRSNPPAYIVLTFLIVAGNTGLPICLRAIVTVIQRLEWKLYSESHPSMEEIVDINAPLRKVQRQTARGKLRQTLQFILDHPRRLTTHMFSSLQTKVLGWLLIQLILIQYFFFLASTMNREKALDAQTPMMLAGIGYFQTLSTRAAGFSMMDLRQLNQGLLFVYAIMMYLSAFPFVSTLQKYTREKPKTVDDAVGVSDEQVDGKITSKDLLDVFYDADVSSSGARSTHSQATSESTSTPASTTEHIITVKNEFESVKQLRHRVIHRTESQQTLGEDIAPVENAYSVQGSEESYMPEDKMKASTINKRFLKHYIFRHSFFLLLAVLILAFSEDHMLLDPKYESNLWYIMFEVISAYGNVGLTMGLPGQLTALSGAFSDVGKCTILFIMWLGKHRGLPSKDEEVIDFTCRDYLVACRCPVKVKVDAQGNEITNYTAAVGKTDGSSRKRSSISSLSFASSSSSKSLSRRATIPVNPVDPNTGRGTATETFNPFHHLIGDALMS